MSNQKRISREQALQAYLAMGDGRSLRKLHQKYANDATVSEPAIDTIKSWSRKYGWALEARKYDEAVRQEVTAVNVRQGAESKARMISRCQRVAFRALDAALAALKEKSEMATTTQDLAVLLGVAVKASEMADRLMGYPIPESSSGVAVGRDIRGWVR